MDNPSGLKIVQSAAMTHVLEDEGGKKSLCNMCLVLITESLVSFA